MELDDLLQRAAENGNARFATYLEAIAISAEAVRMGAESKVAEHIHYGSNTVRKLAVLEGLPDDLIDLDAKPGMYWAALWNTEGREEYEAAIRQALAENVTTPAGMKKLLGVGGEQSSDAKWINDNPRLLDVRSHHTAGHLLTLHVDGDWNPAPDAPERVRVTG